MVLFLLILCSIWGTSSAFDETDRYFVYNNTGIGLSIEERFTSNYMYIDRTEFFSKSLKQASKDEILFNFRFHSTLEMIEFDQETELVTGIVIKTSTSDFDAKFPPFGMLEQDKNRIVYERKQIVPDPDVFRETFIGYETREKYPQGFIQAKSIYKNPFVNKTKEELEVLCTENPRCFGFSIEHQMIFSEVIDIDCDNSGFCQTTTIYFKQNKFGIEKFFNTFAGKVFFLLGFCGSLLIPLFVTSTRVDQSFESSPKYARVPTDPSDRSFYSKGGQFAI